MTNQPQSHLEETSLLHHTTAIEFTTDRGFLLPMDEITESVFRQWRLVTGLFAVLLLGITAYIVITPKQYEAEMVLLVKNDRAGFVEVPSTDMPDSVTAQEAELLQSRDLLRDVVRTCKLRFARETEDSAIRRFQSSLKVSPVPRTSMIRVRYSNPDAATAVQVLRYLGEAYRNKHLAVHSTPGAYQFFHAQAVRYEGELRDAQATYADFQKRNHIVSLNDQKALILRKLVDLEAAHNGALASREEVAQKARTIRNQLSGMTQRIVTAAKKVPNQLSVEQLTTLLTQLQNKSIELRSKFPDDDRNVQQLNEQIQGTKAALDHVESNTAVEETSDLNPVRMNLENELSKAEYTDTSELALARALGRDISTYHEQLDSLEALSAEDNNMTRDIAELTESYQLYMRKQEEARIAEELDREKISNVAIAEPPFLPSAPVSKFGAGVIGSFLLGTCLIGAVALWRAVRLPAVYTTFQLESTTGLPVLGSFELTEGVV